MNVLIVNSDREFLSEATGLLSGDGHGVSVASDVMEALAILEWEHPDLVVVESDLRTIQAIVSCVSGTIRVGDLVVDPGRKSASFKGEEIQLSPIQFRLLHCLARNAGQTVEYSRLMQEVWGRQYEESEAQELLKVHVFNIRRKLGWKPTEYLLAMQGFGYTLTS